MKVKVHKNKKGYKGRVTVTVHDEKTGEEFECELPWHKLALVKYLRSEDKYGERMHDIMTGRILAPHERVKEIIGCKRTLVTPKTKEYPEGRRIHVDDLPKICMRFESDQDYGDFYLAPEGYWWR